MPTIEFPVGTTIKADLNGPGVCAALAEIFTNPSREHLYGLSTVGCVWLLHKPSSHSRLMHLTVVPITGKMYSGPDLVLLYWHRGQTCDHRFRQGQDAPIAPSIRLLFDPEGLAEFLNTNPAYRVDS